MSKSFSKKALISVLATATLASSMAQAQVQKEKSLLDSIQRTAFEMIYFGGPMAILGVFAEPVLTLKDRRLMEASKAEAQFFADRVLATQAGETGPYESVSVRLAAGDVLTVKRMVQNSNGLSSIQDVVLNTASNTTILLEKNDAAGAMINGKALISQDLVKAHAAAQRELRASSDYDGSMFEMTNDALLLNKVILNK